MSDLESALEALERLPDERAREQARAVVRSVLALHADGLRRTVRVLRDAAPTAFAAWAEDPLVAALLVLHDLHPAEAGARVTAAIERLGPSLARDSASAQLRRCADGVAEIELVVKGDDAGRSKKWKAAIVDAVTEAAPDLVAIEVLDARRDLIALDARRRPPTHPDGSAG